MDHIEEEIDEEETAANLIRQRDELIAQQSEELKIKNILIEELQDALKKSTFVTASNVTQEYKNSNGKAETTAAGINNAKYRSLLQVKTVKVNVSETGDYIIYSDPVAKVLELRKEAPRIS